MTPEIKQRIEQMCRGEVPEGYKKGKLGIVPEEWNETSFSTLFTSTSDYTDDLDTYPLYSLTIEDGITPKTERYERSHLVKKEDSYKDLLGLRQIIESGIYRLILAQGLSDEEVEQLESINAELETKLRREDYDIEDISDTDMAFHKAIAETTHNSLVVMIHDFVADLTSESRHRTIEKVFEENDREYLVRTHRMALDALEKKPGSDVDEALRYSYYYWKDSYNW